MGTITISDVVTMAREKSDNVNTAFVSDAEIIRKINSHWQKLYSIIVSSCKNYYLSSHTITLTSATEYPLPADFFKMIDVRYENGDRRAPMFPAQIRYQSRVSNPSLFNYPRFYIIKATTIQFIVANVPMNGSVVLNYAAEPAAITSGASTISAPLFTAEWLACSVAIELLGKEESDVSVAAAGKAEAERLIIENLPGRDIAAPEQAIDVEALGDDLSWHWGVP